MTSKTIEQQFEMAIYAFEKFPLTHKAAFASILQDRMWPEFINHMISRPTLMQMMVSGQRSPLLWPDTKFSPENKLAMMAKMLPYMMASGFVMPSPMPQPSPQPLSPFLRPPPPPP